MSELETFLTKRIEILENLLKDEREKSHQLTLLLLSQSGELEEKTIVSESVHGHGKMRWPMMQVALEKKFKKKVESIEEINQGELGVKE